MMSNETKSDKEFIFLGDLVCSTDKQDQFKFNKNNMQLYHLGIYTKDKEGNSKGELFFRKPDGTEVPVKYINFRQLSDEDIEKMPAWKKPLVQLRSWIALGGNDDKNNGGS